jgi:GxxExxY protein
MSNTEIPLDELTHKIISAGVEVHSNLGPGLLESVYQECLAVELKRRELHVQRERHVPLNYKGERIETRLKVDLLVEDRVIVEVKAVDILHPIHQAQVVTYLKLTGCPAGLLMNFNSIVLVGTEAARSSGSLRKKDHLLISCEGF